ncbi:hypothetical protein [Chroococcus sp. FPU101]|uniref:hypothetical protein n=1 Tax=Chroococcus sp. FPU101 TaxID=1974212 RepID=UPI001AA24272|nr:hypothetical protein [Chroococcus sp. FPU101]GFE69440.1 hypothetical protein CFPU101_20500 [Chroococcus sp. FPU101]
MIHLAEQYLLSLMTGSQTWLYHPAMINFLATISDKDVDIIGNVQTAFHKFVVTGQVWALIIGIVVGYMFKGFTSY